MNAPSSMKRFLRNVLILAAVIVTALLVLRATTGDGAQAFDYAGF